MRQDWVSPQLESLVVFFDAVSNSFGSPETYAVGFDFQWLVKISASLDPT